MALFGKQFPYRKYVLLLAVLSALVGGSWAIAKLAVNELLYLDAVTTAQSWARHLGQSIADIDQIANGEKPSADSIATFERAQRVGQIFRYKIFDRDGHLRLDSSDPRGASQGADGLGKHNPTAARAIMAGQPFVGTKESNDQTQRAFFAEAYLPIVVEGRTVAIIEAYVDQTEKREQFRNTFILTATALGLLTALAFGIPAVAWYRQNRQLRWREEDLRAQNVRFDAALNNMSQGLSMFDDEQRVVVCNDRYAQMYGLTEEQVKPGTTLRQILEHRIANGIYSGHDPEEYMRERLAPLVTSSMHVDELSDGRAIAISRQPMRDGGWVTTHDDITARRRIEKELYAQNLRFDAALNNMSQGLCMFDSSARLVVCNKRYIDMYGLSPDLVKPGCTVREILDFRKKTGTLVDDPGKYVSELLDSINHGKSVIRQVTIGDGRIFAVANQPMPGGGWVGTHEDITERKRAEDELYRTRIFLDTVIENAPAPIFVKDAHECRFVLINRAAEEFFGVPRIKMIGKNAYEVYPKEYADSIVARDNKTLESDLPLTNHNHKIHTPGNGVRIVTAKKIVIRDNDGQPQYLLTVIEDMTERKQAEAQIAHMAHYDALTNLPNRVLLNERLEAALSHVRRGERLAMLYLDLDHFKRVNDTLGHPAGDELLKSVADRLQGCVREIDTIARLGGDEFVIIQTSIEQPSDAVTLATRIREAIKAPYDLYGHQVVADVSIGISIAPNDGTEQDQLLKNADMALYEAKTSGRGTYCFYEPEMDIRMKTRSKLEHDLRKALANGEFELLYQPLVSVQSEKVTGFEALLRWNHPARGMISPTEFIPIAEETGLIVPLGEWVIRTACAEAATWPDDIKVAVNLSPAQMKSQNIVQVIINTLATSELSAHRLELEITESVLMQNTFATLSTLHQLRELGVRIAMDDFGTGYSSLSYLRSFPFDKIKIDRSFIGDLSDKEESLAIVQSIVDLASSLKMTTIAEGVETQQQFEMVKVLGCTEMQGYLFSPPRPASELFHLFLSARDRAANAAA